MKKEQLGDFLQRFQAVFTFTPEELGNLNITQHVIEVGMLFLCMFPVGKSAYWKDPFNRITRWVIKLKEFDYTIVYKLWKTHLELNCLS